MEKRAKRFQNKVSEKCHWNTLKEAVFIFKKDITAKAPWVSEKMIREMDERRKWKNIASMDGISAEVCKNLNEERTSELVVICKEIHEGVWLAEFTKAFILCLPKKLNATTCEEYRTINLITQASKILLWVLNKRLEEKARDYTNIT
ncbi:uncharacterized protein LOC134775162 [Penaeus indicus]|uniref:uncharacterized protein LOC134775162 n=1 Tax=Penaeus indicus TaxID=29960 RepID=UPI00300C0615